MPIRDLRDHYGGRDMRSAVNRAIRAECPGGGIALDRLATWHHICRRLGWGDGATEPPIHVTAYRHLLEIVDAMELDVRHRWGMPDPPPRQDLERG